MATVSTYFKMMDQFSRPLQSVSNGVQTALAAMERLKRVVEAPVSMSVNTTKAVETINRTKAQLASNSSESAIQVAIDGKAITQELKGIRQRLQSGLSSATLQVDLDTRPALQKVAQVRDRIASALGEVNIAVQLDMPAQLPMTQLQAVDVPVQLELPHTKEIGSRIATMLKEVSPTVTARLAIEPNSAYEQIFKATKQLQSMPIGLKTTLDASEAMAEVERLKQRISSGAFSAIHVMLDAQSVTKVFQQIQQRMRSETEKMMVEVTFNARQAVSRAQMLRRLLEKELDSIRAKIQVDLPASLTVMFTNLQRMVMQFIAATRRLRGVAGNHSSAQQQIVKQQQRILQLQNQINASTQRASQASNDWLSNLKGIAATYLSFQGVKTLFGSTVGGAMEQQKMLDMFIARAGDIEIGTGMFKKFKADALAAGQDVNKALQSTLSFFSSTQNVDHLTKLNNLTSRLSAFDSAGNGIEGAAFALKEAMSGDIVSLAERFNMSKADIRAFKIDELGKSGDIDGFIKAFDLLLQKQRMGQEAFDRMMASPAKQAEVLGSNIKSAFTDAGISATIGLMPLIKMLNDAFKEGKFQPFFDGLSAGLRLVADVAAWAGELILNNLDIVRNILIAIGIVAIAVGIKFLAAWVMAAWPIFLIIGIITGLIALLNYFGVSTSDIIGYIAGSFMALVAFIWNRIAFLWNVILSFAEFLVNIFIDPIYAVKKLFYDLAMAFGGQVYNMLRSAESFAGGFMKLIIQAINGVLKGFNWLSDKVKDLFGIDMGQATLFDEDNVHAMSDAVQDLLNKIEKPTSNKNVLDFSGAKMKPLDQGEMFNKGFSFGSGAFDSVTNAFDKVTDFTDWNKQADLSKGAGELDKVGKVGQLDKIKDTVDISSEDLKLMRELAEMKNVQNFVTLQPSINFGDTHVRRESDINTIVARITDKLQEDIASSVDAAYV